MPLPAPRASSCRRDASSDTLPLTLAVRNLRLAASAHKPGRRVSAREPVEWLRLALRARIDHDVDQAGGRIGQRLLEALLELSGIRDEVAPTSEGLDHALVARLRRVRGRRDALGIEARGAAADAVVIDDYKCDRQSIATRYLDLHAAEAEGRVALDRHDLAVRMHGCGGD